PCRHDCTMTNIEGLDVREMDQRHATEQMVDFAYDCDFAALPDNAVEVRRALLIDSIGCALAGHGVAKGTAAVRAAADFGSGTDATIAGAGRASLMGATFANAELLNAIDMDSILRLTHV